MTDPFARPTPRQSNFASADSFRGRLVLIEPTKVEFDVPKQANQPNGPKGTRVTATVTVVDGKGPVQSYSNRVPGAMLEGDVHRGVWFGQEQISAGLLELDGKTPLKMVLARIDTLKPGSPAGQGNPWVLGDFTDADAQTARDYLAGRTIAQASQPAKAEPHPDNPFG